MNIRNKLNSYLALSGWTLTDVAKELTLKYGKEVSVQNLSQKLIRGTIKYSEVLDISEIIGYDITWIKKGTND